MHGVLFDSVAANTATRRFITLTPQNLTRLMWRHKGDMLKLLAIAPVAGFTTFRLRMGHKGGFTAL